MATVRSNTNLPVMSARDGWQVRVHLLPTVSDVIVNGVGEIWRFSDIKFD